MRKPSCHPERRHHAKGLCKACFRTTRHATCHPERPVHTQDLCKSCAGKAHYRANAEQFAEKRKRLSQDEDVRAYHQRYREAHRAKAAEYQRSYRELNKERLLEQKRRSARQRNYNLTHEQFTQALLNQNGVCKLCSQSLSEQTANVDHCHRTRRIRGILCTRCNMTLGFLEKARDRIPALLDYCDNASLDTDATTLESTCRLDSAT